MRDSLILILLLCFLGVNSLHSAINRFDFVGTNPNLPLNSSLTKIGSQIELIIDFEADKGLYTIEAFRNSDLSLVVSKLKDFEYSGGRSNKLLRVPLTEGVNDFFVRIIETSVAGGMKSTNTSTIQINRDLEYSVSSVRLNHVEGSNQSVPLFTRENLVTLFYTISGSSDQFEVFFFRNFSQVSSTIKQGPGNYSETNFALETDELNILQIKVRSIDANGTALGFQKESNILTIINDQTDPKFVNNGISTTFQTNPPPNTTPPTPWGPTDLASIGLLIETDQPNARVEILNTSNGDVVKRFAEASGRLVVGGIELPKDPALGPLGITTTTYSINVFDEAGNFSVDTILVERLSLEPCFTLLKMEPSDNGVISNGQSLNIVGAVCEEQKPHRVVFSIASRFSENSFFKEEQLANLMGGGLFNKDITIPVDVAQPDQNVEISVQAVVFTTNPVDPRLEVSSPTHDLGVVILDRRAPVAPSITTEKVVFASNAPTMTIDGLIEREASVTVNITEPFIVRPSRNLGEKNRQFRAVLDLGFVADGEYEVDVLQRDKAGNSGIGSSSKVIVKYDRRSPEVKSVRVNHISIEQSRPLFFNSGDTIRIQVLMDEYMTESPKVWITQQGGFAIEAGLGQVISEGFEYEYQYVVLPSQDGNLDGPVEILVTDGSDNAGNPITPSHRESQAFVVDTLAPVLFRRNILPADGSVINSAPTPLRLVMEEHPDTKGGINFGSGPDPAKVRIEAFGPLEGQSNRPVPGRVEIFGPRTVDFYPDPSVMNIDGTYLFQIYMADKVGNEFVESVILSLDQEKLSTNLIIKTTPEADFFYNFSSLPRHLGHPEVSLVMESSLTSEMKLTSTMVEVFNYLRRPQQYNLSQPVQSSSSSIRLTFVEDVLKDGSDDGVFTVVSKLVDLAGNISDEFVFSYFYDSQPPQVMDGTNYPLPLDYSSQDYRFPKGNSVVGGPLDVVSAIVFDKKSNTGFLGSGINTSVDALNVTSSTTIELSLIQSFGSQLPGSIVTGVIKFKGDLSQSAPIYGGPMISRVLFEVNVDPLSQVPVGLPADGSYDGIYEMKVIPVDMSLNRGKISTCYFLYDTVAPTVSIDVLNEVWITSGVIALSGSAMDSGTYPLVTQGFGSTKGTGVRTVQMRIDAVNSLGSATFPAIIEWTSLKLDKDPLDFSHNQLFNFKFDSRFRNYKGKVRISVRAIDQAGNVGIAHRDIGLDEDSLEEPVLVLPIEGLRSSGGVQKFRWNPVSRASAYVLELVDSMQNIHLYEYEAGIIEANINLDPLPDGITVWKVLAVDGSGNQSLMENGRQLVLDRQRPQVLSQIIEDPVLSQDQFGRILETQVRVHLKFSEPIDSFNPPELQFLPAPKHFHNSLNQQIVETYPPINLQIIGVESDRVTAMFSLKPSDSMADYNGIGRLRGAKYKDLTGISGEEFNLDFELDLGPYFDLRVFSNPVKEQELIFIIKGLHHKGGAIETISGTPYTVVRQTKNPGEESSDDRLHIIELNRINLTTFQGTYPLDLGLSGNLIFEITGADEQGNKTTRLIPFEVTRLIYTDEPLRESISKIPATTNQEIMLPSSYRTKFPWTTNNPTEAHRIWNIFPKKPLARSTQFELNFSELALLPGKYGLMEPSDSGKVHFIPQQRRGDKLSFKTRNPHEIIIIQDDQSPKVEIDHSDLMNLDQNLRVRITDDGVGIDPDQKKITLDGRDISNYGFEGDEFQLPLFLFSHRRSQSLMISAKDYLGNEVSKSVQVQMAGPVKIESALVVPNPNQGIATLQTVLSRDVQSYEVGIYDLSGELINKFSGGALRARSRISLESFLPTSLANGVYIIKFKVRDSSQTTDRKMVKFVILR